MQLRLCLRAVRLVQRCYRRRLRRLHRAATTVQPTPATLAIPTVLKAGERVFKPLLWTKTVFHALRGAQPLFHALLGVKTLSGTLFSPPLKKPGYGTRTSRRRACGPGRARNPRNPTTPFSPGESVAWTNALFEVRGVSHSCESLRAHAAAQDALLGNATRTSSACTQSPSDPHGGPP